MLFQKQQNAKKVELLWEVCINFPTSTAAMTDVRVDLYNAAHQTIKQPASRWLVDAEEQYADLPNVDFDRIREDALNYSFLVKVCKLQDYDNPFDTELERRIVDIVDTDGLISTEFASALTILGGLSAKIAPQILLLLAADLTVDFAPDFLIRYGAFIECRKR